MMGRKPWCFLDTACVHPPIIVPVHACGQQSHTTDQGIFTHCTTRLLSTNIEPVCPIQASPTSTSKNAAGLMLSLGAEGALGFVVSHELVHGHHKLDRWLANVMLCTTGYMHWSVSHIAHHTKASACDRGHLDCACACIVFRVISLSVKFRDPQKHTRS